MAVSTEFELRLKPTRAVAQEGPGSGNSSAGHGISFA
jgi:hypothetical protein